MSASNRSVSDLLCWLWMATSLVPPEKTNHSPQKPTAAMLVVCVRINHATAPTGDNSSRTDDVGGKTYTRPLEKEQNVHKSLC